MGNGKRTMPRGLYRQTNGSAKNKEVQDILQLAPLYSG